LTFAEADYPFTLIHDCLLVRSCDMDTASRQIREHFVDMYRKPVLQDWADQMEAELPDDVIIGDLNKVGLK
jgi:DNA-directed RNA polymerase